MNLAGLLIVLLSLAYAWVPDALAQSAAPVLRGIVITQSGQARAYFEDPTTGALGAYGVGDVIGDSRIEQIHEDLVVLRRGDATIRIQMGSAPESETSAPGAEAVVPVAASPQPAPPAPGVMPVYRPNPTGGPTIGNGQPYLDRLGIPPQALSRAIEEAQQPTQESDSDNLKD
jgi:hypothetical protein